MSAETFTVVVDAENVRRSAWPNVSGERLVELVCAWAAERRCRVVGSGSESADDWIAAAAPGLGRYWLVTSDRELRRRAGGAAERVLGGGSFLRDLQS